MGIPILVFEGGESKRLDGFTIDTATRGIQNIMSYHEMIKHPDENTTPIDTINIVKTAWVRASEAGMFIWSKNSGIFVKKGEELGVIKDVQGNRSVVVRARMDGYIIGHNNAPVVNSGDALFHIGLTE